MKYLFNFALFISCYTSAIHSEVVASPEIVASPEVISTPDVTDIYICEALQGVGSDLSFVGKYSVSQEQKDGVPVYTSEKDMSFFRNTGFWYLGNLNPWPPQTHYRCVEIEGCNRGLPTPASTAETNWSASKLHGRMPVPVISYRECASTLTKEEL